MQFPYIHQPFETKVSKDNRNWIWIKIIIIILAKQQKPAATEIQNNRSHQYRTKKNNRVKNKWATTETEKISVFKSSFFSTKKNENVRSSVH